ncbi:unnamed protein product [Notodromas monacha]|uniref:Glycerol kinase n=1 Tax=Notodromas monacha TaxID=399045 RepID=A0A7R9GBI9_9CRUS|nr:unnamed protein product [Notodromas monacha]CAG0915113.1 unnamed protein product [Notodromas monacha]
MADADKKFVLAVDVGSSSVRCHVYDKAAKLVGKSQQGYQWLYPEPGLEELKPDQLFDDTVGVIKGAVSDAGLTLEDISCMGITTQRSTWVTWDKVTGEPFHNFISWNDSRGTSWATAMNQSMRIKLLNFIGLVSHNATGNKRFCAARILQMKPGCIKSVCSPPVRFNADFYASTSLTNIMGEYARNKKLRRAVKDNRACFGTVDTWLVYRLTGRREHVTDYSEASATLLFDPYARDWGWVLMRYVGAPKLIMPKIMGSCSKFGHTDLSVLGAKIPITCLIGDQAASMYGARCFKEGDVNLTLGTGGFFDMNTGQRPHTSLSGTYPVCAWAIDDKLTYMAESSFPGVGTSLELARRHGLIDSMSELHSLVTSVDDSDGIHFVSGSDGGLTMGDDGAGERFTDEDLELRDKDASAEGLSFDDLEQDASSVSSASRRRPAHFLRAIVESIAFRAYRILKFMDEETHYPVGHIKVSGGVARSDFLLSTLATLSDKTVCRPIEHETTILGAALLTGITLGIYPKSGLDAREARSGDIFRPEEERRSNVQLEYSRWSSAVFQPSRSTISLSSAVSESGSSGGSSSVFAIGPDVLSSFQGKKPSSGTCLEDEDDDSPSVLARSVAAASL